MGRSNVDVELLKLGSSGGLEVPKGGSLTQDSPGLHVSGSALLEEAIVDLGIARSRDWTYPAIPITHERTPQLTYPADTARGHTDDEGMLRNISGHNRTSGNQRPCTDRDRCDTHRASTDRCAGSDRHTDSAPIIGRLQRTVRIGRAWEFVICEDCRRSDEHAVAETSRFIHERIVLKFAVVA